jgi:hypothetical protein
VHHQFTSIHLKPPSLPSLTGTFHKAFLVTLEQAPYNSTYNDNDNDNDGLARPKEVVIRLALPFMPSLKTLSEIGTMHYIRSTCPEIPIPTVYAFDASANNVLKAEWILMSKVSVHLDRLHGTDFLRLLESPSHAFLHRIHGP